MRTDKEGYRVDEHGNRVGDVPPGGRDGLGSDGARDGDERVDETVGDPSRDQYRDGRSDAGRDRGTADPRDRGA